MHPLNVHSLGEALQLLEVLFVDHLLVGACPPAVLLPARNPASDAWRTDHPPASWSLCLPHGPVTRAARAPEQPPGLPTSSSALLVPVLSCWTCGSRLRHGLLQPPLHPPLPHIVLHPRGHTLGPRALRAGAYPPTALPWVAPLCQIWRRTGAKAPMRPDSRRPKSPPRTIWVLPCLLQLLPGKDTPTSLRGY